jgi:beta-lactamase regulating signal transducer with metallopeptidase domain
VTGPALIMLAWKSTLVSALALLVATGSSNRACSDRVLVLKLGALCLLMLPLLMVLVPATHVFVGSLPTSAPQSAAAAALPFRPSQTLASTGGVPGVSITAFYWAGVAIIAFQLLAGLAVLLHWTVTAHEVGGNVRQKFAAMLGDQRRTPRALASPHVSSPLSWGVVRPVILLDRRSVTDAKSAEAILAHELAHIRHGDWPALMAMRAAVAIFWFNPLVWLLAHALEEQMERAADEAAARCVGVERYAEILIDQARGARVPPIPALAMVSRSGRLSRRVLALLNCKTSRIRLTDGGKLAGAAIGFTCVTAIASLVFATAPAASARQPEVRSATTSAMTEALNERSADDGDIPRSGRLGRGDAHFASSSPPLAASPPNAPREFPRPQQPTGPRVDTGDQQAAAQMERDAGTMDRQADAIDAQARIVRDQASAAGVSADAREQVQRQADDLASAAAALRGSAAATRSNAAALLRNEELANRLSQAP